MSGIETLMSDGVVSRCGVKQRDPGQDSKVNLRDRRISEIKLRKHVEFLTPKGFEFVFAGPHPFTIDTMP